MPEYGLTGIADATSSSPRPAAGTARSECPARGWVLDAWWIPLGLALVTFAVFSPALRNGFVEWDDYTNLFENPHFRGLHWANIRWMFCNTLMGHFIPVTWLTFGLDYTLWGMNPLGYHLTNILLHTANTVIFYVVGLRLLGKATSFNDATLRLAAAASTLFFSLHPLRAESVAWATERRDVLSGLFFLLTILAYLRAAESEGSRRRWLLTASSIAFAISLASKSIVMTLPLILVVLDFYPLGRLEWRWREWARPAARAVLVEKIPYLVLGLAGALESYYAVASNHYLTSFQSYPWSARIGMTAFSLWFYFAKTAVPIWLSLLYELPLRVDPLAPRFLLPALGVLTISALAFALRRRWPAGLAVWLYYGIFLGPVTGIVHSGHQLTHDRYSYLSCLGWALLVGAGVGAVAQAGAFGTVRPWLTRVAAAIAAVWILGLATLTWYQVQAWQDTETLWRYGAESDPECSICQINLADAYLHRRQYGLAREKYELGLRLRPDRTRVYASLGVILLNTGDPEGALENIHRALKDNPHEPGVLTNLGFALINQRRYQEAIGPLRHALYVKPDSPSALTDLGVALAQTGKPQEAIPYLLHSAEVKPKEPATRYSLVRAYLAVGNYGAAREQWDILAGLDAQAARLLEPPLFSVW
ncbi:MAG TPA: tetratricopeptide repeat protein [Candidatus Methylomirabilis sp.]|nr:tetratricopeptide repeat protein [Candidatus Methylomirabilis sp.]